jgi:hypothetical protein
MPEAAGAEARNAKSPQERLFVSMRVSTKPISAIITRTDALYNSEDNKFQE